MIISIKWIYKKTKRKTSNYRVISFYGKIVRQESKGQYLGLICGRTVRFQISEGIYKKIVKKSFTYGSKLHVVFIGLKQTDENV